MMEKIYWKYHYWFYKYRVEINSQMPTPPDLKFNNLYTIRLPPEIRYFHVIIILITFIWMLNGLVEPWMLHCVFVFEFSQFQMHIVMTGLRSDAINQHPIFQMMNQLIYQI